jgi:hypothetical protein
MIASSPNLSVDVYTMAMGIRDGNVVSIGDNQVFRQLRLMRGDTRNHHEIYDTVSTLHSKMEAARKEGDFAKARIYRQLINNELFVKEVVNVEVDGKKSDFNQIWVLNWGSSYSLHEKRKNWRAI